MRYALAAILVMAPIPDQPNLLAPDEMRKLSFVHGLGIAVDQQNFMSGRRECLEQEHPEVGHKVAGDPVVRGCKAGFA